MIQPRDLVVIGASRGGLEALNQLASELTIDFPAAVLIVLHTSPDTHARLRLLHGSACCLKASSQARSEW